MKLENLTRQHNTIITEIILIMGEIEKGSAMNVTEVVLHINKLSGHLNMHLLNEDKFLYPKLLNSSDLAIKNLAIQYNNEMGDLANIYTKYKNDYNTSSKINERMDSFISDTKSVMQALTKRIEKENNGLYKLIEEKHI
jgi:hemerythrin-like domain-containing protein